MTDAELAFILLDRLVANTLTHSLFAVSCAVFSEGLASEAVFAAYSWHVYSSILFYIQSAWRYTPEQKGEPQEGKTPPLHNAALKNLALGFTSQVYISPVSLMEGDWAVCSWKGIPTDTI